MRKLWVYMAVFFATILWISGVWNLITPCSWRWMDDGNTFASLILALGFTISFCHFDK